MQSTPRGPKQVEIVKRDEKHLKRYLGKRPTKDTTEKGRAGAPKGAAAARGSQQVNIVEIDLTYLKKRPRKGF